MPFNNFVLLIDFQLYISIFIVAASNYRANEHSHINNFHQEQYDAFRNTKPCTFPETKPAKDKKCSGTEDCRNIYDADVPKREGSYCGRRAKYEQDVGDVGAKYVPQCELGPFLCSSHYAGCKFRQGCTSR